MYALGKSLVANAINFSSGLNSDFNSALNMLTGLLGICPSKNNNSEGIAVVFSLDEGTLLKIFSFLPLRDLLSACQVCRLWYRLSFDFLLWRSTDLRRFSKCLNDPIKFQALAINRLAEKINCVDLSGFILTEESIRVLATQCKKLRVLKLKSVTFAQSCREARGKETMLFPKHLDCLDIRFSHGNPRVYRAIGKELSNVKWLGLCDAFFQTLLADEKLETTIDSMKHLRKLDVSHCLTLKDSALTLFTRCRKLEVLSVRRCSFLSGTFIDNFITSCTKLRTLILDGISLEDETLQKVSWRSAPSLKHLELGWCPFITPAGLKSALPQIARIQSLDYLGLCAIGDEKALNDNILFELGVSLSCWRSKKLKSLNVGRSRALTRDGVDKFLRSCSFVDILDTTDCPAINRLPTQVKRECKNAEEDQVFDKNNDIVAISGTEPTNRRRNGSISTVQFARSKYILETPL